MMHMGAVLGISIARREACNPDYFVAPREYTTRPRRFYW
jgi:hypothetical protein